LPGRRAGGELSGRRDRPRPERAGFPLGTAGGGAASPLCVAGHLPLPGPAGDPGFPAEGARRRGVGFPMAARPGRGGRGGRGRAGRSGLRRPGAGARGGDPRRGGGGGRGRRDRAPDRHGPLVPRPPVLSRWPAPSTPSLESPRRWSGGWVNDPRDVQLSLPEALPRFIEPPSVVAALRGEAGLRPGRRAFTFLAGGEVEPERLTWRAL